MSNIGKYFNREIYNKGKRTYRIIFENNYQMIEDFDSKSIQRIIQLMGCLNTSDLNYFDLMPIIDENDNILWLFHIQKVNEQDEYTQNHILNQRKCLNNPNVKYIISGFSNYGKEIIIPSKSLKKISQMMIFEPEYISYLDTLGFIIVYKEEIKTKSSIESNDNISNLENLIENNNNDNKGNNKTFNNYFINNNQDKKSNIIRKGIYSFYFSEKPIRIIEKSSNKIRELIGDKICILDQINYTKMSKEDEIEFRKKFTKNGNFNNLEKINEKQSQLMKKIIELQSVNYIFSGNHFCFNQNISISSKSFQRIYKMISRKDKKVIVLNITPIILKHNNDRKLITKKNNQIGNINSETLSLFNNNKTPSKGFNFRIDNIPNENIKKEIKKTGGIFSNILNENKSIFNLNENKSIFNNNSNENESIFNNNSNE